MAAFIKTSFFSTPIQTLYFYIPLSIQLQKRTTFFASRVCLLQKASILTKATDINRVSESSIISFCLSEINNCFILGFTNCWKKLKMVVSGQSGRKWIWFESWSIVQKAILVQKFLVSPRSFLPHILIPF